MKLNQVMKLYIPLEYLENGKLTNISQSVIIKINDYYNEFAEKYGGVTIYDANGRYYNKEYNGVFNIKTQILEMYISEEQYADANEDFLDLALYIKNILHQESVAIAIDNRMRFV